MKRKIILIDEAYDNDKRVLEVINNYQNPIIINCNDMIKNKHQVKKIDFSLIIILIKVFYLLPYYLYILRYKHHIKIDNLFTGLKRSIFLYNQSIYVFKKIKETYPNNYIDLIYANDLFCGLIGVKLAKYFNTNLIYDAHEVEFHRNRKNGLYKIVFDIYLESKVIKFSKKMIVVNNSIKKLYLDIYNLEKKHIVVKNNNHFEPYFNYPMKNGIDNLNEISILYVGAGVRGRMLKELSVKSLERNINVNAWFLLDNPNFMIEKNWLIGSKDYHEELLNIVSKNRTIMWCCTEDICLSYKLSLPNKFFQAIAMGVPIIAYKDTYLAELVKKYEIGFIYDNQNFDEIISCLNNTNQYIKILNSVSELQKKIFVENIGL